LINNSISFFFFQSETSFVSTIILQTNHQQLLPKTPASICVIVCENVNEAHCEALSGQQEKISAIHLSIRGSVFFAGIILHHQMAPQS